jgi:CO dehydrogenase nickel-insertion accessory protein CooC1
MQAASTDHPASNGELAIHLVLQGKGGVGKTVIASFLAEFLSTRTKRVCTIDGDPVNRSLGQYKALAADKLDLVNDDGLVQRSASFTKHLMARDRHIP